MHYLVMPLPSSLGMSDPLPSLRSEVWELSFTIDGLHHRLEDALRQHEKALLALSVGLRRLPGEREAKANPSASSHSSKSLRSTGLVAQLCSSGMEVTPESDECESELDNTHLMASVREMVLRSRMEKPASLQDNGEVAFSMECKKSDGFIHEDHLPVYCGTKFPQNVGKEKIPHVHFAHEPLERLPSLTQDPVVLQSGSFNDNGMIATRTKKNRGILPREDLVLNSYWADLMEKGGCDYRDCFVRKVHECQTDEDRKAEGVFDMISMTPLPWGVLHPVGSRKLVWSFFSLLLITYDVFALPLEVFPIEKNSFFAAVEWTIAVFWTLDIPLNFRTAYFEGGDLKVKPPDIARNYVRTWLVPDLMLVIFEWIFRFSDFLDGRKTGFLRVFMTFRGIRALRLVRLVKLPGILHVVEDVFDYALEQALISVQFMKTAQILILLIKMTAALIVLIHLVTCGWYSIGDNTENGWTTYAAVSECGFVKVMDFEISGAGAVMVDADGTVVQRGLIGTAFLYFNAARWVTAQMNGRTDQDARRNLIEMIYTCIVGIVGPLVLMAVFVSTVTNCMLELSSINSEQKANGVTMKQYVKDKALSPELLASLKEYIKSHKDLQKETEAEKMLLGVLTKKLQENLLYEVRCRTICFHAFFKKIHQANWKAIKYVCAYTLQPLVVEKGDQVFDRGEVCSRMLFVCGGEYNYDMAAFSRIPQSSAASFFKLPSGSAVSLGETHVDVTNSSAKHVGKGMWVSEAALWLQWRNRGCLLGREAGALFTLEAKEFAEHVHKFVEAFKISLGYAEAFAKAVNENKDCVSDLMYCEPYFPNRDSTQSLTSDPPMGRRRSISWLTNPSKYRGPGKSRRLSARMLDTIF